MPQTSLVFLLYYRAHASRAVSKSRPRIELETIFHVARDRKVRGVCVWIDSERKIGTVCCVTPHDPLVTQRLCRDLCRTA